MDYFIDIRVLPDPEFKEATLLNALYAKLHRQLAATNQSEIGVSFPNARKTLGDTLRLHGGNGALAQLMDASWLKGLRDYTESSGINPVPAHCQHRSIRRMQVKSSVERLLRRSLAKGWISEEEAQSRLAVAQDQQSNLPYLQVNSGSTGQSFKLFIKQGKPQDTSQPGHFNAYGLSRTATVPVF